MNVKNFLDLIGADFFVGVPDSQLKSLCDYLYINYGISDNHIIAANEGNCVALAAGYHLATGKIPVVYLQNSGIGNIINPVASLLNNEVYGIPCIFIIGWRGEPGKHDEPQHIYQGKVTLELLKSMDINTHVVDYDTTNEDIKSAMIQFRKCIQEGRSVAFVIKKGALSYDLKAQYKNDNKMMREEVISHIIKVAGEDIVVSTTGKASRELFEVRQMNGESHKSDFMTVGSMGHSSSIALGIALNKPESKVWCIDGDGAVLMHMGAMVTIGSRAPQNLIHIVINNGAHESVGGQPTAMVHADMQQIALGCRYSRVIKVNDFEALDKELMHAKMINQLTFIEIGCAIGARDDLGRPTSTPQQNKSDFMRYLEFKH